MLDAFHAKKGSKFHKFCEFKYWWRKSWARRLNLYRVIMVVGMSQMSLRTSVQHKGLNGS